MAPDTRQEEHEQADEGPVEVYITYDDLGSPTWREFGGATIREIKKALEANPGQIVIIGLPSFPQDHIDSSEPFETIAIMDVLGQTQGAWAVVQHQTEQRVCSVIQTSGFMNGIGHIRGYEYGFLVGGKSGKDLALAFIPQ